MKTQTHSTSDSAHLDISLDLPGAIFNDIHIDTISYAKSPPPLLFRDVKYKDDAYGKPPGCTGPASDQCLNDDSALVAYVYYPKDHDYSDCTLYPMVFSHPGGFAECSSLDQTVSIIWQCVWLKVALMFLMWNTAGYCTGHFPAALYLGTTGYSALPVPYRIWRALSEVW